MTLSSNARVSSVHYQKLENAKKLGILSLTEHGLDSIPKQVFEPELAKKLRTLDLSGNKLAHIPAQLATLTELKTLNLDGNKLVAGTLSVVAKLSKLQKLSVSGNRLGQMPADQHKKNQVASPDVMLPPLPSTLKEVAMAQNSLQSIPQSLVSKSLQRLEKVDLSGNQLASVDSLWVLSNLVEIQLDDNVIVSLPPEMGTLKKLKVLSLRNNAITATSQPQPLPAALFTDTPLIDLNLHGNPMTNTELNRFEGFPDFLERRQKVKKKTLVNLSVCGLE